MEEAINCFPSAEWALYLRVWQRGRGLSSPGPYLDVDMEPSLDMTAPDIDVFAGVADGDAATPFSLALRAKNVKRLT